MNIQEKVDVIRRAVLAYKNRYSYVEIDEEAVDCIYDFYNIVISSTAETILQKILEYSKAMPPICHLSFVCLYVGFFCEISFDSALGTKISICYYKLAIESGNALACINLGNQYLRRNNQQKALVYYKLAIKNFHPDKDIIYQKIAKVWSSAGHYPKALKYYDMQANVIYETFRSGGQIKTRLGNLYNNIFITYCNWGKRAEAVKYFEMVRINENNDFGIAHFCGAWCCQKYGNIDIAIRCYELALINKFVDSNEIYYRLGTIYFNKKEYSLALKYWKKLLKEGQYEILHKICIAHSILKDDLKSLKYFKKCITHYLPADIPIIKFKQIFRSHKNHDSLLQLHIHEKGSIKILKLLISLDKICTTSVEDIGNYFSTSHDDNWLHTFIRDIIRSKLNLLEAHFKYAISSEGYNQAKIDFYNMRDKNSS